MYFSSSITGLGCDENFAMTSSALGLMSNHWPWMPRAKNALQSGIGATKTIGLFKGLGHLPLEIG